MKLEFAFFAHLAHVYPDGSFSIINGGWTWIASTSFPSLCPNLSLVARFEFPSNECDRDHECSVKVTAPSGAVLQPSLSIKMRVPFNKVNASNPNTFTGQFKYDNFLIDAIGDYRFDFFFGDHSPGQSILHSIWAPKQ
jgi:hypothetical protein